MASRRGGRCRTRITVPHKYICVLLSKWLQVDKGHASVDSYTADMLQFLGTYNLFWTPTPENMKLDSYGAFAIRNLDHLHFSDGP